MSAHDPVARRLAAMAVSLAAIALGLSIYAVWMAFEHRAQVRSLGDVLRHVGGHEVPIAAPPPELDPDDR